MSDQEKKLKFSVWLPILEFYMEEIGLISVLVKIF